MRKETKEILTGVMIGMVLSILFFSKLVFGAELSEEDAELLAKVVQCESGNQDIIGRRLVAATVINRVDSPIFPDTVSEVLAQKGQFATYPKLEKAEATWQDRLAVKLELEQSIDKEVMYFRTDRYGCGQPLFVHDDHYFSK